jgi:hypothetical protein
MRERSKSRLLGSERILSDFRRVPDEVTSFAMLVALRVLPSLDGLASSWGEEVECEGREV